MKIQVNLMNEMESIVRNKGTYNRIFQLTDEVKRYKSKKGVAQIVINPGKGYELDRIALNNNEVEFDQAVDGLMKWRWNVPIKITFDQSLLNLEGDNWLNLVLTPSQAA